LLPMFSGIALHGWRGFGAFTWRAGWRRWLAVPLLLLIALLVPRLLMGWTPRGSFAMEMTSFAFRALFAYLAFVGGLIALTAVPGFSSPLAVPPGQPREHPPAPSEIGA